MFKTKKTLLILSSVFYINAHSQTILNATGSNDTYALINSVLAPGYDVTETPDCGHVDFGSHIDEVFDADINDYAFRFHIHVDEDNDRCVNFDRQRNEIKTYDQSPDYLLGVEGETVVYKWKFKIDVGFQPSSSFTHLHQIKAVGGSEDSLPTITLTARAGSPDDLELRYSESTSQTTILKVDLDLFKGNWVEVVETITYGEETEGGAFNIEIQNIQTGDVLLSYNDEAIRMWKTDADFMRPKWGIYRGLNNAASLRDEAVLFTGFSIEEINNSLSTLENIPLETLKMYQDFSSKELVFSSEAIKNNDSFLIYNLAGQLVYNEELIDERVSVSLLKAGFYVVKLSNQKEGSKALKIIID